MNNSSFPQWNCSSFKNNSHKCDFHGSNPYYLCEMAYPIFLFCPYFRQNSKLRNLNFCIIFIENVRQKWRKPAISCRFSCADLFRLHTFMGDCGFEPQKALPADLQSVPFGHSGNLPCLKSWWTDLNPRPIDYKSIALPAELHQRMSERVGRDSVGDYTTRGNGCQAVFSRLAHSSFGLLLVFF